MACRPCQLAALNAVTPGAPALTGSPYVVTEENVGSGPYVGLGGIARKLGIQVPDALTDAERAAAPSADWAGWLGEAKLIAAANNMTWAGPPTWGTTPLLEVGQSIFIPRYTGGAPAKKTNWLAWGGGLLVVIGVGLAVAKRR